MVKIEKKRIVITVCWVLIASVLTIFGFQIAETIADMSVDVQSLYRVHYINVGQGNATLIQTPEGNILIDAGTNVSEGRLIAYLRKQGVQKLTYAVFTHAHEDHIGGADAVLKEFGSDCVMIPVVSETDTEAVTYQRMKNSIPDGVPLVVLTEEISFSVGKMQFRLIPASDDWASEGNDTCCVILATVEKVTFMFMGDAEEETEQRLLTLFENSDCPDCDVLQIGHHGSNTSSSEAFLDAVKPEVAVISVGAGNSYGHPTARVLNRLTERDIQVLRTDTDGDIVIYTNGFLYSRTPNEFLAEDVTLLFVTYPIRKRR